MNIPIPNVTFTTQIIEISPDTVYYILMYAMIAMAIVAGYIIGRVHQTKINEKMETRKYHTRTRNKARQLTEALEAELNIH